MSFLGLHSNSPSYLRIGSASSSLPAVSAATTACVINPGQFIRSALSASVNFVFSLPFLFLVVNVVQAVASQEMGFYMVPYSTWLLYATTSMYTAGFGLLALYRGEDFGKAKQFKWLIVGMGIATTINGIGFQVSNVQIAPEITVLLQNAALPANWLLSWVFKGRKPSTPGQIVGLLVVSAGVAFGVIQPLVTSTSGSMDTFNNGIGWILMSFVGCIAVAFQNILQEVAFDRGCPKAVALFWYNLFSLPWYFVWLFASLSNTFGTCVAGEPDIATCQNSLEACASVRDIWSQEGDAWRCFVTGGYADVPCCGKYEALVWVLLFVVGYVAAFALCAELLNTKHSGCDGTTTVANLQALSIPVSAFFFWWRGLAGLGYSAFRSSILLSAAVVFVGTILYENAHKPKAEAAEIVDEATALNTST